MKNDASTFCFFHRKAIWRNVLPAACVVLFALRLAAKAQSGFDFFETHIRPVLVAECVECHGAEKHKAGLRLDSRAGWQKGGESGEAIKPGYPDESLLLKTIRHEIADLKMPDKAPRLDDLVIERFRQWIAMGAPDPRDTPPIAGAGKATWAELLASRRNWWSLQPILTPPVPKEAQASRSFHPVDVFLDAAIFKAGLSSNPPASAEIIVRRLHFILTGLPPNPEEVQSFVRAYGSSDQARSEVVRERARQLMDSFAFGEHWARHWMDLVRYADSHGSEGDPEIPNAYQYRDYLIRAFNADVPIDRLIREHIAGDLLANPRISNEGVNESLIGPAHLRMVDHGFQPVDTLDDKIKAVDNQIDVITKAFLALTVSCARCHDHKFDAVSQKDYTALYGIFGGVRPAQLCADSAERLGLQRKEELLQIKERIRVEFARCWNEDLRRLPEALQEITNSSPSDDLRDLREKLARTEREIARIQWKKLGADARVNMPAPVSVWTFSAGPEDVLGGIKSELIGDATVFGGSLVLNGQKSFLRTEPIARRFSEKSLEAWVYVDDLNQRGGGVLGIEGITEHAFDSLVFGESAAKKWLPGSNNFKRTKQPDGAEEISGPQQRIHVVISYSSDGTVTVYRNGKPYGEPYKKSELHNFVEGDTRVLIGLRHTGAGNGFFHGRIDEARVYDLALSSDQVATSFALGTLAGTNSSAQPTVGADDARLSQLQLESKDAAARIDALAEKTRKRRFESVASKETHPLFLLLKAAKLNQEKFFEFAAAYRKRMSVLVESNRVENARGFQKAWDLSETKSGWHVNGPDVSFFERGDFRVSREGSAAFSTILPSGVGSGSVFGALGGIVTSPEFKLQTKSVSVRFAASNGGMLRIIPDNYPLGNNSSIFQRAVVNRRNSEWLRLDTSYRVGCSAYVELTTLEHQTRRADQPKGGASFEKDASEFLIEKVVFHDGETAPKEEFAGLSYALEQTNSTNGDEYIQKFAAVLRESVDAWRQHSMTEAQRELLDSCVESGLLTTSIDAVPDLADLVARYRRLAAMPVSPLYVPGVLEHAVVDAPLLERGDHKRPGETVPRAFLSVFGGTPVEGAQSGRLELAEAMLSDKNPLTPRVMVNRIWHWTFGAGIVATVDNFGRMGEKPSNPELLDFMARQLVANKWSLKRTLEFLLTSDAFQRSSVAGPMALEKDPANQLLSHYNVRRLDAEPIRDALLKVSGLLDKTSSGPSLPANTPCRSVYLRLKRNNMPGLLSTFDAPKPFTTMGKRDVTTVPAQSLTLLNDPAVHKIAASFAANSSAVTADPVNCAGLMFQSALGRPPTPAELQAALDVFGASRDFSGLAHAIFNLKEFIYLR